MKKYVHVCLLGIYQFMYVHIMLYRTLVLYDAYNICTYCMYVCTSVLESVYVYMCVCMYVCTWPVNGVPCKMFALLVCYMQLIVETFELVVFHCR